MKKEQDCVDFTVSCALADVTWCEYVQDILHNEKVTLLSNCKHHKGMSRLDHCIHVSYSCYLFLKKYNYKYIRDAVRGALLHDFFLYDYSLERDKYKFHPLTHPKNALLNAEHEFSLTKVEKSVIIRHMFPLTIIPPCNKAAWAVILFDKVWAVREFVKPCVQHNSLTLLSHN